MDDDLRTLLVKKAASDPGYAIAAALMEVADAQREVARRLTNIGALDLILKPQSEALDGIATALTGVADAVREVGADMP